MAKFGWALLCRRVIIDRATNAVSYIDALEGLAAPEYPVAAPLIIMGGLWRRERIDEDTLDVRTRVEAPSGETLISKDASLKYEPEHKRGRINIGLKDFNVPSPGRYFVVVEHRDTGGWTEDARLAIDFEAMQSEGPRASETRPARKRPAATKTSSSRKRPARRT